MATGWIVLISIACAIAYMFMWWATAIIGVLYLDKEANFSIICILWPIVLPIMLLHLLLIKIFG